jgi:hypothetical protein
MMIIASAFVLAGVANGLGLFAGNVIVMAFHCVTAATIFVIGIAATMAVLLDSYRNLGRFGTIAVARPRWWFEMSRLIWIVFLFMFLLAVGADFAGLRLGLFKDLWVRVGSALFIAFLVLSTVGYVISAATGQSRNGRAFECTQYFYWLSCAIVGFTTLVIWIPARVAWAGPVTVALCIAAASIAARVLTIAKRAERHANDCLLE